MLLSRKFVPQRGFTLIQLLVSIIIIGIIGSIVMSSASSSRIKGRDSKRLSDLNQMKVALEFYREANGHYPYTCDIAVSAFNFSSFDSTNHKDKYLCTLPNGLITTAKLTDTMATYISMLSDPKRTDAGSGYIYVNTSNASSYCFMIFRSAEDLRNFPSATINPARCGGISATGQCNVNGTFGEQSNSIFIGKGTYATTGC